MYGVWLCAQWASKLYNTYSCSSLIICIHFMDDTKVRGHRYRIMYIYDIVLCQDCNSRLCHLLNLDRNMINKKCYLLLAYLNWLAKRRSDQILLMTINLHMRFLRMMSKMSCCTVTLSLHFWSTCWRSWKTLACVPESSYCLTASSITSWGLPLPCKQK